MSADPMKEPSAAVRTAARGCFEVFNALMLEGFTEPQALMILGAMMFGKWGQR